MPTESILLDQRDLYKEKKHERSEGLAERCADSPCEFVMWESADFRRPHGHSKHSGFHAYLKDSDNGYAPKKLGDGILEDKNYRSFPSPGHVKYIKNGRENKGILVGHKYLNGQFLETSDVSFSSLNKHFDNTLIMNNLENIRGSPGQKDLKGNMLETIAVLSNGSISHLDANDQGSFDDIRSHASYSQSETIITWDQPQFKDQYDSGQDMLLGQRCERDDSLGSIDWGRPLKWSRSGNHTSRNYGFSHSIRSKCNGADIVERKTNIQTDSVIPIQSPAADSAPCALSVTQLDDTFSRKKQRLGWGEGLAKYEKKKVDSPDENENKNIKPDHSIASNLAVKSPILIGSSDFASISTPSSVGCSSSLGMDDRRDLTVGNDGHNLNGSPDSAFQNHAEGLPIYLENSDFNLIDNLSTSITDLLHSDWIGTVDSSFLSSTSTLTNKLVSLKSNVLKSVELIESEIDQLENELRSLKSKPESVGPYVATSSSLHAQDLEKSCEEQGTESNMISRPTPLKALSKNMIGDDMLGCKGCIKEINTNTKVAGIDSPGIVTSKFVEPPVLVNAVAPCRSDEVLDHDAYRFKTLEVNEAIGGSVVSLCEDASMIIGRKTAISGSVDITLVANNGDNVLQDILINNKVIADRSPEVFNKLLPKDQFQIHISEASKIFCSNEPLLKKKFLMGKRSLRFKERIVTLKFRAFSQLWKEDMRLLPLRKSRAKLQKKIELSSQVPQSDFHKHRSSLRYQCYSPEAGDSSVTPTTKIINCASKLFTDMHVRQYRSNLKMPSLILGKEKVASRFINTNGLVEDPSAVEKEKAMINPWTLEEKEIFMDKLAICGKDFKKIGSFLDHKTIADCIEFYYKNHKLAGFKKTKNTRESGKEGKSLPSNTYLVTKGKTWNPELSAASLLTSHVDVNKFRRKSPSGRFLVGHSDYKPLQDQSFIDVGSDKEAAAADVLVGICGSGSSEAMSSCITSSVDPSESNQKCQKVIPSNKTSHTPEIIQNVDNETCSDESCGEMDSIDFTDEDKSLFVKAVSSYGKDFSKISCCVGRSRNQCKVFFSKARKCLGLDFIQSVTATEGAPLSDDMNGGGSGAKDGCVVEISSASKMDVNFLSTAVNTSPHDENLGPNMNLQTDEIVVEETKCIGTEDLECPVSDDNAADMPNKRHKDCESVQQNTVLPADLESIRDEITEPTDSVEELQESPLSLDLVVQTEAISANFVEGHVPESEGYLSQNICLNDIEKKNEESKPNKSRQTSIGCFLRKSKSVGDTSDLDLDLKDTSYYNLFSKQKPSVLPKMDCNLKSPVFTLWSDGSLLIADAIANQDISNENFMSIGNHKQQLKTEDPSLKCVGPSYIFRDNLQYIPMKEEANKNIACERAPAVSVKKVDMNLSCYIASNCLLNRCSGSKVQHQGNSNHLKTHVRSFSDTDKQKRNGDVKLFGQILTHPASLQKTNTGISSHANGNSGIHCDPKLTSESYNLKFNGHHPHSAESSIPPTFDQAHHRLNVENFPVRSYGFWDGNRIKSGYSHLPDSALLLAKYPAAFGNFPTTVNGCERALSDMPILPNREIGNGVTDFQAYRNWNGVSVVNADDMKHMHDMYSEVQRQKQHASSVIEMNVMVEGVSDPVVAIKMHYASGDQHGGNMGR